MNQLPPGVKPLTEQEVAKAVFAYYRPFYKNPEDVAEMHFHKDLAIARLIEARAAQAGYLAGLEAAAKVCEEHQTATTYRVREELAAAIRDLKGKQ